MKKIFLLADDDNDDAELFAEALSDLDPPIDFQHVQDGQEVFEYLNSTKDKLPDLIFMDLNMPEISGWQCLARIKNDPKFRSVPVIMYSTSSHLRDREIALELGAEGFITKPSSFKMLQEILRSISKSETGDLKKVLRDITSPGYH